MLIESNESVLSKTLCFLQKHFLIIILVLFYTSEALGKVFYYVFDERIILAKTIKGIVIVVCLVISRDKKILFQLFLLIGCFVIGQLFITPNFNNEVIQIITKYLFPIILAAYFNKRREKYTKTHKINFLFEYIIYFNSALIIFGFLLDIHIFKTYRGPRFGYNGLFISSATGSYVYLVYLLYFLKKYRTSFLYKKNVLFIIISSLLIGTKSVYIALICVLLAYFWFFTNRKTRNLGFIITIFLGSLGSYYLLFKSKILSNILTSEGFLTAVLSYRDVLFKEKMIPFINENWLSWNYFFGGVNSTETRPQLGFIDLFYFMGLLGGLLYLYFFSKNYFTYKLDKLGWFFVIVFGLTIFISGNFFLNASVVVYIIILREYFLNHEKETTTE